MLVILQISQKYRVLQKGENIHNTDQNKVHIN